MGLSTKLVDEVFGTAPNTPYLLNVSDDPMIPGCLIYMLTPGVTVTVGRDPENVIQLEGPQAPAAPVAFSRDSPL